MNSVSLVGRVVSEPESKTFNSGSGKVEFRLAVGRGKKQADGSYDNSDTCYIDCEVWKNKDGKGGLHDVVVQYVGKGKQVAVSGELKFEQWDDKATGAKRSKHKINVRDLTLCGGKDDGPQQGGGATGASSGYSQPTDDGADPF